MSFLPRVFSARSFSLAEFELAPLEFCEEASAELAELILDRPVVPADPASTVVPFPTPGAMRETIERHLETKDCADPEIAPASPAEELRLALAELRRSLG